MKKEFLTDNSFHPERGKKRKDDSHRKGEAWNDRELAHLFGEALGETPTAEETEHAWQAFTQRHSTKCKQTYRIGALGIAAAFIAIVFVCYPLLKPESQEVEVFTPLEVPDVVTFHEEGKTVIVTTPPATLTTIALSDGSKILLGANSRLEYPKQFADAGREIKLAGEARFEVAKDAARPFMVCTDQLQTKVLGTIFDVKAYPNYPTDITLYEGRVCVNSLNQKQSKEMKPGEQVSLTNLGTLELTKINTEKQKSWTEKEFFFDNSNLMQVMQEIGSWYNISVVFRSRPLLTERIYFRISRQLPVTTVLDALNDLKIAQFSVVDGKAVVTALP